jgi:hypothetical protein
VPCRCREADADTGSGTPCTSLSWFSSLLRSRRGCSRSDWRSRRTLVGHFRRPTYRGRGPSPSRIPQLPSWARGSTVRGGRSREEPIS